MYGMRFAQIAQDLCNDLDAQTQDLAPNEALAAKKMIIRKLCRGEGLDDMTARRAHCQRSGSSRLVRTWLD